MRAGTITRESVAEVWFWEDRVLSCRVRRDAPYVSVIAKPSNSPQAAIALERLNAIADLVVA